MIQVTLSVVMALFLRGHHARAAVYAVKTGLGTCAVYQKAGLRETID